MTSIYDVLIVHSIILCWIIPIFMLGTSLLSLPMTITRDYTMTTMSVYVALKLVSDHIDSLPAPILRLCQHRFQEAFYRYFPMEFSTPSVVVSSDDWERPQIILTGPHGVFNMGGIRSIIVTGYKNKRLICAMAPTMAYTWLEPILRLMGTDGMIPLNHKSIQSEMSRETQRDLIVIPGGFIETNTGNEVFSTMDDSKWEYWLLQCLRYGYDASFQWIHGATQVYHTGTYGMKIRLALGKLGIPCMVPIGKRGTVIAHNDIPMTVCGFRIHVKQLPNANRSSPELHALILDFRSRVDHLIAKYPPNECLHQAPVRMISSL
jgi:hypothetical protein